MHVEEIVYSSIGAVVECVCLLLGLLTDLCILFLGEIQLGCLRGLGIARSCPSLENVWTRRILYCV